MRTLDELKEIATDPRAQQMLGLIRAAEGVKHGYNTGFGNEPFADLSKHPNIRKGFTQTDGKKNTTSAAGAYQFTSSTWKGLEKQYGFQDFSGGSQDLGALALLDQKGALDDVLQGDFESAVKKSGSTWASLPSSPYKQPKKSWDFVNQYLAAQGSGLNPTEQANTQVARRIDPSNAQQLVEGALAGLQPSSPQVDSQAAFLNLRKEQLQGEADRLTLASLDNEANLARVNAVRSFFGEEPLKQTSRKLPSAFEDALQEAMIGVI